MVFSLSTDFITLHNPTPALMNSLNSCSNIHSTFVRVYHYHYNVNDEQRRTIGHSIDKFNPTSWGYMHNSAMFITLAYRSKGCIPVEVLLNAYTTF